MIRNKLKITVEQKHFQGNQLEKGKKQSHFPLNMDNYITKRADLSLQIRIVKPTSFMISRKGQSILVTQKQCQLILEEPQHTKKIAARFFRYRIYNDVADYIQKCDRCQRQHVCHLTEKMRCIMFQSHRHVIKQVNLDLCSPPGVVSNRHLIAQIHYFTKWLGPKPIGDRTTLMVATFLYELMCGHCCFNFQINNQG